MSGRLIAAVRASRGSIGAGTTPKTMEGWGWQVVHDPAHLPRVIESWKASLETGEPFELEFPLRSASGEYDWFLTRVSPVLNAEGSVRTPTSVPPARCSAN